MFAQFHTKPIDLPEKLEQNNVSLFVGKINNKQYTIMEFDEKGREYVIPSTTNVEILNNLDDLTFFTIFNKSLLDKELQFIPCHSYNNILVSVVKKEDCIFNLNQSVFHYTFEDLKNIKEKYSKNDIIFVKTLKRNAEIVFSQDLIDNKLFIPRISFNNTIAYINKSKNLIYTVQGELEYQSHNNTDYITQETNRKIEKIDLVLFGINQESEEKVKKYFTINEKTESFNKDMIELNLLLKQIQNEHDFTIKSGEVLGFIDHHKNILEIVSDMTNLVQACKDDDYELYLKTYFKFKNVCNIENFNEYSKVEFDILSYFKNKYEINIPENTSNNRLYNTICSYFFNNDHKKEVLHVKLRNTQLEQLDLYLD
jgi:hypothetical protein